MRPPVQDPRPSNVLAVITNYDFSDAADQLKQTLSPLFHTRLVDADSPTPPKLADVRIRNTMYPGLWHAAVALARDGGFEWLLFIASDVRIGNPGRLRACAIEATREPRIGIWSPSLAAGSRCEMPTCFNRPLAGMRECGAIEGFFFMARTEILTRVYPIPPSNRFGLGVDQMTAWEAHQTGRIAVVDDRIQIFHPKSLTQASLYDSQEGQKAIDAYLGPERSAWARAAMTPGRYPLKSVTRVSTLDLGCGTTIRNPFLADVGRGVDLNASATSGIVSADLNVEGIPFPDRGFDYVTAHDFIEHVPRLLYCPQRRFPFVELMNEVFRVLKPGGIFLSVTPAFPDPQAFQDPTHVNIITDQTFPYYFCTPNLHASIYGFKGRFELCSQNRHEGKLVTLMRRLP